MVVSVEPHEKFKGVYWVVYEDGSKRLATLNMDPGFKVYGEPLVKYKGEEYRVWNPYRSKLAASILNGLDYIPIGPSSKVLYLGASTGTTASHVSDIVGSNGIVYAVEFAPRVMRVFLENCAKRRPNIVPIYDDATKPENYLSLLDEVDVIYCDIAQPQQAKPLADNADLYLRKDGGILLAIKARSIDVTLEPSEAYKAEMSVLENRGFNIRKVVHLEPYDKDHAMVAAIFKKCR